MVSAYIYYNIDTDFIVLKFLLFMVVTSYYWIWYIKNIQDYFSECVCDWMLYLLLKIP